MKRSLVVAVVVIVTWFASQQMIRIMGGLAANVFSPARWP